MTDSSLAANKKKRTEALHVVFFNQASEPSTMSDCCLLLCVYSRMIRSHENASWVLSYSWSVGPRPCRPTTAVVCPRRGAAAALAHCGCTRNPTHPSLLVLLYAPRTAATVYTRLWSLGFLVD